MVEESEAVSTDYQSTETAAVANRMLRRGRDAGRTAVERVTETEG